MSPISSCVHISADLRDPHLGHAWRDKDGDTFATVRFGGSDLAFTSTEDARAMARACTEAADALGKLAAEQCGEAVMTRQNREGSLCPPWCTTDHDEEIIPGEFANVHASGRVWAGIGESGSVTVAACLMPLTRLAEIHVSAGAAPPLFVPVAQAEGLASLAELLAGATPGQHREMAAAIRQAAKTAGQAI